eukprot:CAMPEP_0170647064 /NCGR_PEP_ID=MMETSP0224-20130122/43984_1 /TAXON_ID=285029 /ORGANISM="Togula jolla, Strain CCCM 725" /LENGTH=416 /DNA_ID=CAMNT_0010978463 /DNA_START=31 /DNA_END=1281 /DNA_ORIENTATION=-
MAGINQPCFPTCTRDSETEYLGRRAMLLHRAVLAGAFLLAPVFAGKVGDATLPRERADSHEVGITSLAVQAAGISARLWPEMEEDKQAAMLRRSMLSSNGTRETESTDDEGQGSQGQWQGSHGWKDRGKVHKRLVLRQSSMGEPWSGPAGPAASAASTASEASAAFAASQGAKSHGTVEEAIARYDALVANLTRRSDEVKLHKAEYENEVKTQQQVNAGVKASIDHLTQEIAEWRVDNEALKTTAETLRKSNHDLAGSVRSLLSNFSSGKEYVEAALVSLDDSHVAELDVLKQDKDLDEGPRSASLLQVMAGAPMEKVDLDDVMSDLEVLQKLSSQSATTLESLKQWHDLAMSEQAKVFQGLSAQQATLMELKTTLERKHAGLRHAVDHLEETSSRLREQRQNLSAFLSRVRLGRS